MKFTKKTKRRVHEDYRIEVQEIYSRRLAGQSERIELVARAQGPIYLVMRLYWPKTEPPSILPPGEGTWQPPGIEVAK